MSKRYDQMFADLQTKRQAAFVPFVMLGDPDIDMSIRIIEALIEGGADALELGIPFSDPIADGPTIQAAAIRAMDKGVTPQDCLAIIAQVRQRFPHIPIGLLLYSNLIMAKGIDNFYRLAAEAGVDSVLVADVPMRESKPFRQAAMAHEVAPIFIAPPNACDDTLRQLASHGRGYTYLLSRAGVTGAETVAEMPAQALVERLQSYRAAPSILGFGISQPQQVRDAVDAGAAGAISGSAVVKIIEDNLQDVAAMTAALTTFCQNMKAATAS